MAKKYEKLPCVVCVKLGINPPKLRRKDGKCFFHLSSKNECEKCIELGLEKVCLARLPSNYCQKHGDTTLVCKEKTCKTYPQKKGYCDTHYIKHYGELAREKCKNCNKSQARKSGMCHRCYNNEIQKSEKQIINSANQEDIAKLRKKLGKIVNGVLKDQSCENLTGVNVEKLKKHLEGQFQENMDWDSINKTWHIDFVKAPSTFVANPEKAFYYKNLVVNSGKYKYH